MLGNSGETGPGLIRVGELPFDRSASGVAMDRDSTLWVSGGDTVNRVGLNGRLIERFSLEPAGSSVDSRTFAVLNGRLYLLGHVPGGQPALFELTLAGEEHRTARALPLKLPERRRECLPYALAPQPVNGRLVLAAEMKDSADPLVGVYFLDPNASANAPLRPEFTRPGEVPGGIAVDETRGIIYLGGSFGLHVAGETNAEGYSIVAVRADGSPTPGDFPVACPKTPAIPTQFRGVISLAGGALWDTAWYGFLARLDLQGRGAPGRIVQWHHDLGYPTQILGLAHGEGGRPDLLAITCALPDALYLAHWDESAQQIALVRRIGCLPTVVSLGLSADGWVTVGTMRAQLWWPWEAAADAPPEKAELHIGVTPGYFVAGGAEHALPLHAEDRFFTLATQYRLDDLAKRAPVACVFNPRVGDRNEANRVSDPVPMKKPVGLSVQATPGQPNGAVFVSDADTKRIWRTEIWLPDLRPDNTKWRALETPGLSLEAPTDLVALSDGRLLVADAGCVLLLESQGEGYRETARFERWGDQPTEQFGLRLRFAVDGAWMLVSDAERHRVVWFDWTAWQEGDRLEPVLRGQLGETDVAGDDARHLYGPTLVSLRGTRAVVVDAGNQRVVKLNLIP